LGTSATAMLATDGGEMVAGKENKGHFNGRETQAKRLILNGLLNPAGSQREQV
jgi:hypothetical protein